MLIQNGVEHAGGPAGSDATIAGHRLSDYDYELPEELIAQEPLADRSASRLLVLRRDTGAVEHRRFADVPDLLQAGDLLVMNDTRVTALRLLGRRATGGQVEALLLAPTGTPGGFVALMRPGKRLRPGAEVAFGEGIHGLVTDDLGEGRKRLTLSASGDLNDALARVGRVPLPPYIHAALADPERYQTVYSKTPGSAAAPTAGLHFTAGVIKQLAARGVKLARVSLDVSIDTFRPVQHEDLGEHVMHGERCRAPESTAEAIASCKGRVIAVGTTTVRTLESLATGPRQVPAGEMVSRLFILPGYTFRAVDGMFTNFHMPRTTMLMMISALAGRDAVMNAYNEALRERYRFLSFGDAMLIL